MGSSGQLNKNGEFESSLWVVVLFLLLIMGGDRRGERGSRKERGGS